LFVELFHGLYCSGTMQHASYQSNTTHEITQQISRKLLRMDVVTSEICWALNNGLIKQVTSSWTFVHYVYCRTVLDVVCVLYTLEFLYRLFNADYFLLQVSTVQFHLSERTEGGTGRPALCLSSFTIVWTAQNRKEEISNVEKLDRCCF